MKEGYTVENQSLNIYCDCIVVSNFKYLNEIINYPFILNFVRSNKISNSIGVWKIKIK